MVVFCSAERHFQLEFKSVVKSWKFGSPAYEMKFFLLLALFDLATISQAEKVISIEKKLLERRRGECVTFQGLHFFKVNGTVTWTRETKPLPQSDPRFVISNEGKTLEIRQLQESDTALYSSMIQTEGGLEITRHWLVVRGCHVNEEEIELNGCETACKAMCLNDWHYSNGKCYRYFSTPKTWLDAYYHCQGHFGAKLATIDNSEDNTFVGGLLQSGSGAWIGLNDRSKESRFLWNYNKFDTPRYFAWDETDPSNTEPNNFNGQCNVESCVEMKSINKKWNDVVCKAHRSYVCERASKEDNSGWKCPGGGTCYWYELETVTWDWARQSCRDKNAMLVKIASNSKNRLIGDMIKTNIWIGLNDRVEAGIYVWNDIGQGQFNNRSSYYNWDKEEPNDKHYDRGTPKRCDGEDCVKIHIQNGKVTWFDLNCEIALPFICEKSRDPYLSFAAWIAISMGAGLLLSIFGGRAYMELIHRKGRKQVKQMIGEATDSEEKKD